jgi:hypothetical protein
MSARRKSHRPVGTEKEEFSDLVKSVAAIADSIRDLHSRALVEYTPLVDGIVQSHCRNAKRIEQTLDGLLDFCDHAPMLVL